MDAATETLLEAKRELEKLLKETEQCLKIVKDKDGKEVGECLDKTVKPWAKSLVSFCNEQKKAAEGVLSLEAPPMPKQVIDESKEEAKGEDKATETSKEEGQGGKKESRKGSGDTTENSEEKEEEKPSAPAEEEKAKEAETDKKEAGKEGEDDLPSLPTKKTRKPKARGRKLPSKNLLATRAKEEDENAAAIKLEESDMPDQVTKVEDDDLPVRRGTQAVPIFNAGVMGELNKALGARVKRKSTAEKKEEEEGGKDEPGQDKSGFQQPQQPLAALKPVKLPSPKPAASEESKEAESAGIPAWKLELQKRKQRKSTGGPAKAPEPKAAPTSPVNELAAILQRRKEKSGG
ncbi:hypothetical protein HOP50_02g16010 [Chloropicon primus]|uniref:Uncharacterized protein n=1 Tax=Chloropicon primus TaxID=1764295 RepID=A0A5B8MI82_9CHLO|nr:hypothetical protein A3770_02p16100 [Chloropicon primus]UPQ98301.1 hypothetical protein HOP50_02g16010 [Chloropicon primus]|eukprot:QDZ19092.1 hypothetical protein A3770_02p16100 [Chloropicon primus]